MAGNSLEEATVFLLRAVTHLGYRAADHSLLPTTLPLSIRLPQSFKALPSGHARQGVWLRTAIRTRPIPLDL